MAVEVVQPGSIGLIAPADLFFIREEQPRLFLALLLETAKGLPVGRRNRVSISTRSSSRLRRASMDSIRSSGGGAEIMVSIAWMTAASRVMPLVWAYRRSRRLSGFGN